MNTNYNNQYFISSPEVFIAIDLKWTKLLKKQKDDNLCIMHSDENDEYYINCAVNK